jgi:hypothetical protein
MREILVATKKKENILGTAGAKKNIAIQYDSFMRMGRGTRELLEMLLVYCCQ